jgi:hypothetical protein
MLRTLVLFVLIIKRRLAWKCKGDWDAGSGKKDLLGDSVIGRTRVRTKRLNEKLIEIQKKTG